VVDQEPPRRLWAARLAAPLAFFAAATILIVLVQRGLDGGSTDTATTATPPLTSPTTTAGTPTTPAKRRFYRVKRGDTLESIAAKFNTTVDDLLSLNPDVDPLALSPRQRIRVS
jgi:LysM repeat protein